MKSLAFFCLWFAAVRLSLIGGTTIANPGPVGRPQAAGGTDWTADSTMVALYYMNSSPGINQDSKQTNHVDDASVGLTPVASAGDKIEGDQSADFENSGNDYALTLLYTNATADFPCNGTGDGEVTFAGWVKPEATGTVAYLMSINLITQFFRMDAGGALAAKFDGTGTGVTLTTTATISAGNWYFVACVYSDTADEIRVYIRQQGGGSSIWETTTASIATLDTTTGSFTIGATRGDNASASCWDGLLDGWAVFNGKAMSQAELDGVFANGWDGNGW